MDCVGFVLDAFSTEETSTILYIDVGRRGEEQGLHVDFQM